MVIGFVNAGIMSLMQAATVIYGANIGTTITGQITALGMFENSISTGVVFATFAGIGAFTMAFAKKDLVKKIGGILAGFGMLFVGLDMMSASMDTFASLDTVKNFLASISNPLLLVLIGTVLTAIIQSSSVMTSIAITMVFTGLINLDQGIYLTMGSNIGSCRRNHRRFDFKHKRKTHRSPSPSFQRFGRCDFYARSNDDARNLKGGKPHKDYNFRLPFRKNVPRRSANSTCNVPHDIQRHYGYHNVTAHQFVG